MKYILVMLFFAFGVVYGAAYTTEEASGHIGENATVCGIVSSGYYARSSRGKPTFINLDGRYPNQAFTVVIWGDHRSKFGQPERKYTGKRICVTGVIDMYRGIPQIIVNQPAQIQ